MACPMVLLIDRLLPSTTTVVLWTLSLVSIFAWIRYRKQKFSFFERRGIPGHKPNIINGNYNELMKTGAPWVIISKWIKKYGNVFGYFHSGPMPRLIVADHEMLKEILIKEFSHFTDRIQLSNTPQKRLPRMLRGSLVNLEGRDWKRVRSTLTPTFSAKKMKMMSSKMNRIIDTLLQVVKEKADNKEVLDIYGSFQGLTLDVIGECAFAMNVDCQRNPQDTFLQSVKSIFRNANSRLLLLFRAFPEIMSYLSPVLRIFASNIRIGDFLADSLEKEINRRRLTSKSDTMDLIQLMIEASSTDSADEHVPKGSDGTRTESTTTKYLTDEEIVGNAFIFLLAGFETTANCLGFTAYLLAKNPDIQQKVIAEIDEVIGKTEPDYDAAHHLPYLEMVVSESLRLYPPVTSFVTRVANADVKIGNLLIPAGTGIEVPVWYLQHDEEVWNNPYEFDPERFSPERKSSIPQMAYMPFGAGPRNCIGMRFAQLEIKLALVRLLQKFELCQCEASEPDIELFNGTATINPKNGVFVRIKKR